MFRICRQQKGRYRQFSQFGVEAIGSSSPLMDVEVILFAATTLKALGLTKMHKTVEKPDNEQIRGMIKTVAHLVTVAE